jgi:hypothetical protein
VNLGFAIFDVNKVMDFLPHSALTIFKRIVGNCVVVVVVVGGGVGVVVILLPYLHRLKISLTKLIKEKEEEEQPFP